MKLCIFGGHYGSEGKGAAAEYWIRKSTRVGRLAAFGENSPNSGHTCSKGKTKNIPASSFFADVVVLGPDSVIDIDTLLEDVQAVRAVNPKVEFYIHEHAAILSSSDKLVEAEVGLITSIGSTGSGSGKARLSKYFNRQPVCIIGSVFDDSRLTSIGIRLINRSQWMHLTEVMLADYDWIFECSQGVLLDTNFGIYPYVTSRSTLPRVAIERNGLGQFEWTYVGVYRTFPIRTGGNSGPTGGEETTFGDIGVDNEIATVTKRIRRVFRFCPFDFHLSIKLARPDKIMFTHADYLVASKQISEDLPYTSFYSWLLERECQPEWFHGKELYVSFEAGAFAKIPVE